MNSCRWLNISFKDQLEVSRCIGRRDYDEAIRLISKGLVDSKEDVPSLDMIALCHHWAQRDDAAIDTANRVLSFDPKSFEAAELLSRIYFSRSEYGLAAKYARLGVDNFPEPLPLTPRFFFRLLGFLGLFSPRLKELAKETEQGIGDPNKSKNEWLAWAKQYLAWYDKANNPKDLNGNQAAL